MPNIIEIESQKCRRNESINLINIRVVLYIMKSTLCPVIVFTKMATNKNKYLHCICKPGERYRLLEYSGLFVLHVLLTIQTILDVVWFTSLD